MKLNTAMRAMRVRSFASGSTSKATALQFGDEARASLARGANLLAKAVAVTLGPCGRNVLIADGAAGSSPRCTKDGVTVARAIANLADPFEAAGARLLQEVAARTNANAGDGTTTATVLARAIFCEGLRCVAAGTSAAALRRGITAAVAEAVDCLRRSSTKLQSSAQIQQVACISANGDAEIGSLIAKAMAHVGRDGSITVQAGRAATDELAITEGIRLDRGYASPFFLPERATACKLEQPLLLLASYRLAALADVLPAMEIASKERRSLLVVADEIEGEALAALVLNRMRGNLSVCAVRAPGYGEERAAQLADLACATGATLWSSGQPAAQLADAGQLGSAGSATCGKDESVLLQAGGKASAVAERCEQLRSEIAAATTAGSSEWERNRLTARLARMTGGVAVISVGGGSEVEVGERHDRFVDALAATRAAVAEGIVPGGGAALLAAVPRLLEAAGKERCPDVRAGWRLVANALQAPASCIADNAGGCGPAAVAEVLRRLAAGEPVGLGWDALAGRCVPMVEAGIVDPLRVVRTALQDAASVAALLMTTECCVVQPGSGNSGSME